VIQHPGLRQTFPQSRVIRRRRFQNDKARSLQGQGDNRRNTLLVIGKTDWLADAKNRDIQMGRRHIDPDLLSC
jgi:hypothetical protein